jgi:hypothetical protein
MISSMITDRLRHADLTSMANGQAAAIVVKSFVDATLAGKIAQRLLRGGYEHYLNAPSIGRIGMAFYEADGHAELIRKYFELAPDNINRLRLTCLPYASPIDILRCNLDEIWPAGANIERLYGRTMFVGLSRVVEPNVCFMAHHDVFEKDAPDSFHAASLIGQFACNVYLDMPETGGDLQIWETEMAPKAFDDMRGDSYGIDPDMLGEPDLIIKPEIGDLVLFNAKKMHSVAPSVEVSRISLSCFIGYRGEHAPLSFWS